jgi:hypothetical protein
MMGKRNRRQQRQQVAIEMPMRPIEMPRPRLVTNILRPEIPEPVLRRTFDAAEVNPIVNHPSVLSMITVPGIATADLTEVLRDPRNICLVTDGGCIMFGHAHGQFDKEPGIYEVHTNFLPEYRGRHAIRASLAAYRWIFTHTDCMALVTRVPAFNRAADMFCRIVGATKEYERKAIWPTATGPVDLAFWALRYDDWVRKTSALSATGHAFHQRLEAERIRHHVDEPLHIDEECHDRYVGACVETVYAGQPEKAIVLYNRWAMISGYMEISLIARSPLVIDIGDALLQVGDHEFKVIKFK